LCFGGVQTGRRLNAAAAGIENPTPEQLARLDRKRKKKTSNKDWKSPADADARVAKMKDGRTHLAGVYCGRRL
jgi:transposase